MKIISEKTGKEYGSVEECIKAEKAYDEKIAAEKAAKEKALVEQKAKKEALASERKARAKEIEDAMKAVKEAEDKYRELLNAFIKDYKSYHYTTTDPDAFPFGSMFSIFKPFGDWFI